MNMHLLLSMWSIRCILSELLSFYHYYCQEHGKDSQVVSAEEYRTIDGKSKSTLSWVEKCIEYIVTPTMSLEGSDISF